MPTSVLTAMHVTLIQRADIVSTHLIILAQGNQSGKPFAVPVGKVLCHYDDCQHPLVGAIGLFGVATRGRLPMADIIGPGYRTPDYILTPARTETTGNGVQQLEATLLRYVDQSDKAQGAEPPLNLACLGLGVPCDLLFVRPARIFDWSKSALPRLSHLLSEDFLAQYKAVHCLINRANVEETDPTAMTRR